MLSTILQTNTDKTKLFPAYLNAKNILPRVQMADEETYGVNRLTDDILSNIPTDAKAVACSGYATWYIDVNSDLYGCGTNNSGNQGSGDTTEVSTYTKRASNVKKVACSEFTTWYITNDGDLYGCGYNAYGQQGNGDTNSVKTFTQRASNVKEVICSGATTWYIDNDGNLYGCGYNAYGQQGNGDTNSIKTFTKRASNVKDIIHCGYVTWYIDNSNNLYGCGWNHYGQQGSGDTTDVTTFTQRALNVKDVFCSYKATWYIDNDGNLYGCGSNMYGEQGNNTTIDVKTFTQRASNVKEVICSGVTTWYIDNDGNLYGCGYNSTGQQGSGNTTDVKTFTQRASNVKEVICSISTENGSSASSNGNVTWYIDNNNNLYGCGRNNYGQQGSGDTNDVSTFTQRASNVKYVVCSNNTTFCIDTDNKLYGCGFGTYIGLLGTISTFKLLAENLYEQDITGIAVSPLGVSNYIEEKDETFAHKTKQETFEQKELVSSFSSVNTIGTDNIIDLSVASYFIKECTANTSFTIKNQISAGNVFNLLIKNGGSYTVTFPANVKWSEGSIPELTTGTDILAFITNDGGVTWIGNYLILDAQ